MLVISQSKPMALPVEVPERSQYDGYRAIDSRMTPETAGTEYKKYPNMSFLGTGSFGVAYDTGGLSDTVVKYIYDLDEVHSYQLGKKGLAGIVKVFNIQKLQNNVWAVIMEKLKPLNKKDAVTMAWLKRMKGFVGVNWFEYNTLESIQALINEYFNDLNPAVYNFNLVPKFVEFSNNLVQSGVLDADVHSDNVGWDSEGNLVLFDLGFLRIRST